MELQEFLCLSIYRKIFQLITLYRETTTTSKEETTAHANQNPEKEMEEDDNDKLSL